MEMLNFMSFSYDFLQISKYFFKMKTKGAFLCEKLIFILSDLKFAATDLH